MIRIRSSPYITVPGVNPAFLNVLNSLRLIPGYQAHFFLRIDRDVFEPSAGKALPLRVSAFPKEYIQAVDRLNNCL